MITVNGTFFLRNILFPSFCSNLHSLIQLELIPTIILSVEMKGQQPFLIHDQTSLSEKKKAQD